MIPNFHFSRISSTNEIAKELLSKEDEFFVTADYQYSGKGRKGKYWAGESYKNVFLSYAVNHKSKNSYNSVPLYQAAGCLSVKRTLNELHSDLPVKLKYPNDVYVKTENGWRKISGTLLEHSYKGRECLTTIMGIGINIEQRGFSEELADRAVSLRMLNKNTTVEQSIECLQKNILEVLEYDEDKLFEVWKNELHLLNKLVKDAESGKKYIVKDFKRDCSITAERNGEIQSINNGDSIVYEL